MSVAKMLKLTLLGYSGIKNNLIDDVHKAGIVEIVEVKRDELKKVLKNSEDDKKELSSIENTLQDISKKKEELAFSLKFLHKYKPKKSLLESFSQERLILDNDTYIKTVRNFKYSILDEIKKLSNKLTELESLRNSILSQIEFLKPWKNLKININEVYNASPIVNVIFAVMDSKNFYEFMDIIKKVEFADCNIIHSTKEKQYFSIIYLNEIAEKIQETIKNFNLIQADFSDINITITNTIKEYTNKISQIDIELKDIENEMKAYCFAYNDMLVCLDYWRAVYEKVQIKKNFMDTESCFLIRGWIKKSDVEKLNKIKERYKEIHIALEIPKKKDDPPVALENQRLISPFEMVTKLFGLPTKKEPDPTPLFAPFFALYFGICLTDAGYGLVLILLSLLLLRNKYMGAGTKKLLNLMIISGIFTVIMGVLAGGFFGIQFEKLPASLQAISILKEKIAFLDPLKNPLRLFAFAIGLGVFQIITGFIIKFVILLKNNELRSAFVESFSWILIIFGVLIGVALKNMTILWCVSGAGACIIILFTSKSKNPLARIGAGLFGLYDITGIFGDIVSYSRLFALALATGVVAMVINIIIGIVYSMIINIPIIGVPVAIIVLVVGLIFGHLFNIGINALGAFVHTTRLQFVEYFTKFYQSGGREFSPFKEKLDYVHIEKG